MEITSKPLADGINIYTPDFRSGAHAAERRQSSAGGSGSDKVVLSPKAREIQDARQQAAALPDVDEGRVQRTRQRITAGTYTLNGDKIAFKMISDAIFSQMA